MKYRYTLDSCYCDTAGLREMYRYSQTIDKTRINLYCLVIAGIQMLCRNKQYFAITDIVISRDYCMPQNLQTLDLIYDIPMRDRVFE